MVKIRGNLGRSSARFLCYSAIVVALLLFHSASQAPSPATNQEGFSAFTMKGGASPSAIQNISVTNHIDHVHIVWEAPDKGDSEIIGYELFRNGSSSAPGTLIASLDSSILAYEDFDTVPYLEYSYWIRAQNSYGYGENSSIYAVVVGNPPGKVAALDAKAEPALGGIDLTWNSPSDGGPVDEYVIMRMTSHVDAVSWEEIARVDGSVRNYTDKHEEPGYYGTYMIVASNAAGTGGYGSISSATIPWDETQGSSPSTIEIVILVAVVAAAFAVLAFFARSRNKRR